MIRYPIYFEKRIVIFGKIILSNIQCCPKFMCRKVVIGMSILQKQVIQSLDGLSDENLQFLLDMILRFMKPDKIEEEHNDKLVIIKDNIHRIGSLEGQDLIDADYDIDECNGEIAEMFGVNNI